MDPYIDFHTHQDGVTYAAVHNQSAEEARILAIRSFDLANPIDLKDLALLQEAFPATSLSMSDTATLVTLALHPMSVRLEQLRKSPPVDTRDTSYLVESLPTPLLATLQALEILPSSFVAFAQQLEQTLFENSLAAGSRLFGIGECGWDLRSDLPLPLQDYLFDIHLRVAVQLHKPIILHVVRAYDHLLLYRKQELRKQEHSIPWVIHGFRGKEALLRQLEQSGCLLSLHPQHLLHGGALPHRYFLETDETGLPIIALYEVLSKRSGLDVATLRSDLFAFFKSMLTAFGNK